MWSSKTAMQFGLDLEKIKIKCINLCLMAIAENTLFEWRPLLSPFKGFFSLKDTYSESLTRTVRNLKKKNSFFTGKRADVKTYVLLSRIMLFSKV